MFQGASSGILAQEETKSQTPESSQSQMENESPTNEIFEDKTWWLYSSLIVNDATDKSHQKYVENFATLTPSKELGNYFKTIIRQVAATEQKDFERIITQSVVSEIKKNDNENFMYRVYDYQQDILNTEEIYEIATNYTDQLYEVSSNVESDKKEFLLKHKDALYIISEAELSEDGRERLNYQKFITADNIQLQPFKDVIDGMKAEREAEETVAYNTEDENNEYQTAYYTGQDILFNADITWYNSFFEQEIKSEFPYFNDKLEYHDGRLWERPEIPEEAIGVFIAENPESIHKYANGYKQYEILKVNEEGYYTKVIATMVDNDIILMNDGVALNGDIYERLPYSDGSYKLSQFVNYAFQSMESGVINNKHLELIATPLNSEVITVMPYLNSTGTAISTYLPYLPYEMILRKPSPKPAKVEPNLMDDLRFHDGTWLSNFKDENNKNFPVEMKRMRADHYAYNLLDLSVNQIIQENQKHYFSKVLTEKLDFNDNTYINFTDDNDFVQRVVTKPIITHPNYDPTNDYLQSASNGVILYGLAKNDFYFENNHLQPKFAVTISRYGNTSSILQSSNTPNVITYAYDEGILYKNNPMVERTKGISLMINPPITY